MEPSVEKYMHEFPPLFLTNIEAGFPSPADDWIEERLDLNQHLVKKPTSTFFLRVRGDSMKGAGIYQGDVLIVDRSISAVHNQIVIATVNMEFTVKRLYKQGSHLKLIPENPEFKPLSITAEMDFQIWGVVTYSIHGVECSP